MFVCNLDAMLPFFGASSIPTVFVALPSGLETPSLEAKVDEALQGVGGVGFVKTCCRSPKDAAMLDLLTRVEWLRLVAADMGADKVALLYAASLGRLKVTTGKGALGLLRRSKRVREDIATAQQSNVVLSLAVRQWVDIEPQNEFRCFVHKV
jgi:hypothetical protein